MTPPYDFTAPLTITPGTHHLEAIAYDRIGTPGSGADSYLGMMRANAQAIARGLSGPEGTP